MRILWLDINSSYSHSSLAIPALDAQLSNSQREQHEWKMLSGNLKSGSGWIINQILDFGPDIILTTVWLYNHLFLREILMRVHALRPQIRVVLGGPEFLGDNSLYLKENRYAEALFRGEGEEVFSSFIESIDNPSECYNQKGFCYLDKEGNYIDNGEATVSNFTALNPPESSVFFNWKKPFVQIETSRGCFNKCTFCISGGVRKIEDIPENTLRERVQNVYNKGIREIRILDRTFNANPKRALKLISIFREFNQEIEFHLEVHPSLLNKELEAAIKSTPAGVLHFEAGVQSLQDKVLNFCERHGDSQSTLEGVRFFSKIMNHEVHTDLIAGLPYYSYKQLIEDLKILLEISPDEIQLELLKLLPGTKLREQAHSTGLKFSPLPPYEILETPWISYKELELSVALSRILDIYYNHSIWQQTFIDTALQNHFFLEQFALYFIEKNYTHSLNREKRGLIIWEFCSLYFKEALPSIATTSMKNDLSFHTGPGLLSKQWKYGDLMHNPLF
ncbi:MAG: DUF4080 domain-containing protein, partial [Bacteroidales bacterium]